jgi:hypothetical protein
MENRSQESGENLARPNRAVVVVNFLKEEPADY